MQYSIQEKADLVIHCGDLFFRSKVPNKIIDLVYQNLFDFAENGIPIFIIPGNHERSFLLSSILLRHPNIRIFDSPGIYTINIDNTEINICGFPFIRENLVREFKTIVSDFTSTLNYNSDSLNFLCMHQVIQGAVVGPENFQFNSGKDVIPIKDIPEIFTAVLSGHIHRQQILWKSFQDRSIPIIYPGSTEKTSFAEKNEIKGFYEFQFSSKNIFEYRFINLESRSMIDINIIQPIFDSSRLSEFLKYQNKNIDLKSIVRLKYKFEKTRELLTMDFLRKIIPPKMIIYGLKKI